MAIHVISRKKKALLTLIDFIIHLAFIVYRFISLQRFFKPRKKSSGIIKRILILNTGFMGDSILNIPLIKAVRKQYEQAEIVMLVKPKFIGLWKDFKHVDTLMMYDAPWVRYGQPVRFSDAVTCLKLRRLLRSMEFDLALDSRADLRNNMLLLHGSGAHRRVGFGSTGGEYFLTDVVPWHHRHELDNSRALADYLGCRIEDEEAVPKLDVSEENVVRARHLLEHHDITGKLIVLCPFAGYPNKEWPLDRFARLTERLAREYAAKIMIIGGGGDIAGSQRLETMVTNKNTCINLTGMMKIEQITALLSISDMVVGCDSGLLHLAAAVGCKTAVLMGPTDPARWRPRGPEEKNVVIHRAVPCAPCGLLNQCAYNRRCLRTITVDAVMKTINPLIS